MQTYPRDGRRRLGRYAFCYGHVSIYLKSFQTNKTQIE